jgi:hypothetical protein
MGPFEIAAIAIIGGFITKIYTERIRAGKGNVSNIKIQELEQRVQALESHQDVKALSERVHVLETIVTTNEFDLQKKFRELGQ